VFGTIAAQSQRLITETYSAFVQGLMPTPGRPESTPWKGPAARTANGEVVFEALSTSHA
jgi:hypothetical protein